MFEDRRKKKNQKTNWMFVECNLDGFYKWFVLLGPKEPWEKVKYDKGIYYEMGVWSEIEDLPVIRIGNETAFWGPILSGHKFGNLLRIRIF